MEYEFGSIEGGKIADIALWEQHLYVMTARELKKIGCQLTRFGGGIVYRARDGGVTVSCHSTNQGREA